jgi:hypothetical protein
MEEGEGVLGVILTMIIEGSYAWSGRCAFQNFFEEDPSGLSLVAFRHHEKATCEIGISWHVR